MKYVLLNIFKSTKNHDGYDRLYELNLFYDGIVFIKIEYLFFCSFLVFSVCYNEIFSVLSIPIFYENFSAIIVLSRRPTKKLLNINCFNIFFMLIFYFISLFEFLWENIYKNYNNNIRKYSSFFFLYLWFYSKITLKYKIIILHELVLFVFCVSHWEKTNCIMASYYTYLSSIYRVFFTWVYFINDYR